MNDRFYNLTGEKQDKMINGAVKVFALQGYTRASTDVIIREAGISKGLLFHYFGSKKNLYEFVCEYCSRYYILEMSAGIPNTERNLFDRIHLAELQKIRMLEKYPYLELFILGMKGEADSEVAAFAGEWSTKIQEMEDSVIYSAADEALLRGNLNLERAREITGLCMDGYKLKRYSRGEDPSAILEGFLPYLETLKVNMTR